MKKIISFMLALSCISPLCSFPYFANADEVQDTHQAAAINSLKEQEIVLGDEYGNIMETDPITREQMAALIGRILGFPDNHQSGLDAYFTDSAEISNWAYSHILSGVEEGYIDGYPDKTFKPKQLMTYEEAVKFTLCAFMQISETDSAEYIKSNYGYPDGILTLAEKNGYLYGTRGTIGQPMSRGDVFTLLYNISNVMITKEKYSVPTSTPIPDISEATPSPTASPEPSSDPSSMSLSYVEAEKIAEESLVELLRDESESVAEDVALQGNPTPELHNDRLAYKFQYYSKILMEEGVEGILGNIYVYDDGSTSV